MVDNVSDKQLGTMIGFLVSPNWFKQNLTNLNMYYGTVTNMSSSPMGIMDIIIFQYMEMKEVSFILNVMII